MWTNEEMLPTPVSAQPAAQQRLISEKIFDSRLRVP
jgi:hypothetical protein